MKIIFIDTEAVSSGNEAFYVVNFLNFYCVIEIIIIFIGGPLVLVGVVKNRNINILLASDLLQQSHRDVSVFDSTQAPNNP